MKYLVTIEEVLHKFCIVEAAAQNEACKIVKDAVNREDIVLDWQDLTSRNIEAKQATEFESKHLEYYTRVAAKISCPHCGHFFEHEPILDDLGWHCSCPECEGGFDVDLSE